MSHNHKITVWISKEAQKEAVRAGQPAQGTQDYELSQEFVARALDLGAEIDNAGIVTLTLSDVVDRVYAEAARDARYRKNVPQDLKHLSTRPLDAEGALDAIANVANRVKRFAADVIEERRTKAKEAVDMYLATSVTADEYGIEDSTVEEANDPERARRVEARRAARQQLRDDRLSAHERAVEAFETGSDVDPGFPNFATSQLDQRIRAERGRREAQLKANTQQQIKSWIADHGTESQRERFAEGVLPEDEIKQALRDVAFSRLAELPRYERITKKEIYAACQNFDTHYGEDGSCEFAAWDAEELTERQFDTLKRIRELAPKEATVTARCHAGGLEEDEEWLIRRNTALVTIQLCGYELSREYSLDS